MRLADPMVTPRLILSTLEVDAAAGPYLSWLRDPAVTRFLEVRHGVTRRKAFAPTSPG